MTAADEAERGPSGHSAPAALGVLTRVVRPVENEAPDGTKEHRTQVWLKADCRGDVLKWLAYAQPVTEAETPAEGRKRGHGGVRVSCPKHPEAAVLRRTTITHICAECGDVIEGPTSTETVLTAVPDRLGQLGPNEERAPWYASSESVEWYTPPHVIERVLRVLGEIDLDPCAESDENPNVPAGGTSRLRTTG